MTIDGMIIARSTKIIPKLSIKPNFVPKIAQLITTEAAGSVVAVIDASSGVKNRKCRHRSENYYPNHVEEHFRTEKARPIPIFYQKKRR